MTAQQLVDALVPAVTLLAPAINWIAFLSLGWAARKKPWIGLMAERAFAALVFAIASTGFAVIAVLWPYMSPIDEEVLHLAGAVIVVALATPGAVWIVWAINAWRHS